MDKRNIYNQFFFFFLLFAKGGFGIITTAANRERETRACANHADRVLSIVGSFRLISPSFMNEGSNARLGLSHLVSRNIINRDSRAAVIIIGITLNDVVLVH